MLAGAAALTHLASAMHRMGIPQDKLDHLHQAIVEGHFVLLLREAADQVKPWLGVLRQSEPGKCSNCGIKASWKHFEPV